MIKPGELRVGNWYMSTKFQVPVQCTMSDFAQIEDNAEGAKPDESHVAMVFKPISLNGDWLIRGGASCGECHCDFELKIMEGDSIMSDRFLKFILTEGVWFVSLDEDEIDCPIFLDGIRFVHEIQDLFRTLTRKELEFSAKKEGGND